jgi:hypothetical protein
LLISIDRLLTVYILINIEVDREPPVSTKYTDFAYIFSKAEFNILPPYCSYDYKIELEDKKEKALKYNLLYKMLLEELQAIKNYITDNLEKGFIKPN